MIPFLPGNERRRADAEGHVRARGLLVERMDAVLEDSDATWLADHVLTCDDCRAAETDYAAQRELLRSMAAPVPPRDLWARTAAKLELEAGGRGTARRSVVPLGALSGALVVAVVVGASLLSQPAVVAPTPSGAPVLLPSAAVATGEPRATPMAVGAGDVGWAVENADGSYELAFAAIDEVCGTDIAPDCAPLDPPTTTTLRLAAEPRAIVKSPTEDQLVVVGADTRSEGGTVYVVAVPSAEPSVEPSAEPSVEPSLAPSPSVGPTGGPSPTPTPLASVKPSPTPSPVASPTATPSPSPSPSPSPPPPASPSPTVDPSPSVEPSPTASADASTEPSMAPSPSPADVSGVDSFAIAFDVIVVGESAAYSSDGAWFAFSARPADGSAGPDIHVWHSGDATARALTTDNRSVFSAWVGDRILGSRAVRPLIDAPAGVSPLPETSVSFLLDPETGQETILAGLRIWRPVVDPTGRFVVYWDGAIEVDEAGLGWRPGAGRLVLAGWDPVLLDPETAGPVVPPASNEPVPSADPSSAGSAPAPSPVSVPLAVLSDGAVREWDIHWDDTGTRFALWIADPEDAAVGTISLHEVDPERGVLDPSGAVLTGVPALPGFSIGDGRLAWATPPGQGGEGSRVVVLAWRGTSAGRVESAADPGSAPLVVIK